MPLHFLFVLLRATPCSHICLWLQRVCFLSGLVVFPLLQPRYELCLMLLNDQLMQLNALFRLLLSRMSLFHPIPIPSSMHVYCHFLLLCVRQFVPDGLWLTASQSQCLSLPLISGFLIKIQ